MPQPRTIRQLIDAWAQTPYRERKCGNLRSDAQGRLWSYAMLIARPSAQLSERTMLVTDRRRSVTTSRHTSLAKHAAARSGWSISDQDLEGERA